MGKGIKYLGIYALFYLPYSPRNSLKYIAYISLCLNQISILPEVLKLIYFPSCYYIQREPASAQVSCSFHSVLFSKAGKALTALPKMGLVLFQLLWKRPEIGSVPASARLQRRAAGGS